MKKRGLTSIPKTDLKHVEKESKRIAFEIQARRKELGLTQEDLAEVLDVDRGTIGTIEQGLRHPSLPTLIRIAKALGLEIILSKRR